jgi:hypothetical protein
MPTLYSQMTPEAKAKCNARRNAWRELNKDRIRAQQREWNAKHPEAARNYHRRLQGQKVLARQKLKIEKHANSSIRDKWFFNQVLRHVERGRDMAQIVVWMEAPASLVAPQFKKAKRLLAARERKLKSTNIVQTPV